MGEREGACAQWRHNRGSLEALFEVLVLVSEGLALSLCDSELVLLQLELLLEGAGLAHLGFLTELDLVELDFEGLLQLFHVLGLDLVLALEGCVLGAELLDHGCVALGDLVLLRHEGGDAGLGFLGLLLEAAVLVEEGHGLGL